MNHEETVEKSSFWHTIGDWIFTIIIALLIALPIRYFIAEPFIVSGASMDPTFASGQFLIVDRISYRIHHPERDDVVIFRYPNNPKVYYIKRIIGLPGETVKISDGKVTIFGATETTSIVSTTTTVVKKNITLDETFISPDRASHESLTQALDVGQYFVMGDNRLQSSDSRIWGPLDERLIVGKPFVRLLPINKIDLFPGKIYEKN